MIVTVKNKFCKKLFVNETGLPLSALHSQKLIGPEKIVVGPDGAVYYETGIENRPGRPSGDNRQYILKQDGALIATALPVYAPDANHFAIPRPPRPIGLLIKMHNGAQWRVERVRKNSVEIRMPDGAGRLSDFFSIRPQVFEIPDGSDVFLWVGVYALIGYMMHEDDVLII
ncbi:MAG: hypothetical protein ACRC3H_01580 [Lachnospiraceae bacterium]